MTHSKPTDLIRKEADFVEAGLSLQTESLRLLLAEMQALAAVLPHVGKIEPSSAETEAQVEADFDNMPI
ncbi:hypothetical protein EI545_00575 [Tabrizicola piscis]|uniref:Uncharacterized protein n=1 Tax=Tabrizicola piscis TaxID=2494374 RepID=A0A3S8U1J2_9RHOB|nr:hypothetical protein [Tabrizicola piscis]AZL57466.1 hypothetical protein EI545_00575 [Tabrizicola piscis]